ncbi:hypothetical protein PG993_000440 [Apiospora rasikravindrae]|uniref:Secreted protein n=1 Tax=Apiospora rasikravindrae TaxID=990691 RepID=A0ABR1U8J9_9PEZI
MTVCVSVAVVVKLTVKSVWAVSVTCAPPSVTVRVALGTGAVTVVGRTPWHRQALKKALSLRQTSVAYAGIDTPAALALALTAGRFLRRLTPSARVRLGLSTTQALLISFTLPGNPAVTVAEQVMV